MQWINLRLFRPLQKTKIDQVNKINCIATIWGFYKTRYKALMKYQMKKGENTLSCMRFVIYWSIKGLKTQDCGSSTRRHSHCHVYRDLAIPLTPALGLGVKNHVPAPLTLICIYYYYYKALIQLLNLTRKKD